MLKSLIALGLAASARLLLPTQDMAPPEPVMPSVELLSMQRYPEAFPRPLPELKTTLRVSPGEKLVEIEAYHIGESFDADEYTCPYAPLAAVVFDWDYVLVAGLTEDGFSVIERWNLSGPSFLQSQVAPSGDILQTPHATEVIRRLPYGQVTAETLGPVRHMVRDAVHSNSVLLQFEDTDDVYRYSPQGGGLTLIASPSSDATELGHAVPRLTERFNWAWSGVHDVLGTIYYWHLDGEPGLMLLDVDSDGLLDASQSVSSQDWTMLGLGPADSYSALYF
jgi:hypothetical protein